MLTALKNRLLLLLQLIIVFIYILFEELIWEGIAKPIYQRIHALQILQKLEKHLIRVNPAVILVFFVLLLGVVEVFGVYAGILFVQGQMLLGIGIYLLKIPIAAFTFWLFRTTETQLMHFGWFKWLYEKIMQMIAWVKSRQMYLEAMETLGQLKLLFKRWRATYFTKQSPFVTKIKRLYSVLKASIKK